MNSNEKNIRTIAFSKIVDHINSKSPINFDDKSKVTEALSSKFKPHFARIIINLWLGKDPLNKDSIYYNEHEAYMVACEEIVEKLEAKDEIFRSKFDAQFSYKEKVDTKKVLLKIVKKSKKYLVLKTFIYMFILLLIAHMGYSYYQVSGQDINTKVLSILSIVGLSILLFGQANKIVEEWAIIHGSSKEIFYSYMVLIGAFVVFFYTYKNITDPIQYFNITTSIIAVTTIIFVLLHSRMLGIFIYWVIVIGENLIKLLKYAFPLFFLVLILKMCASSYHTQKDKSKEIIKKERTSHVNNKIEKAPKVKTTSVNNKIEKSPLTKNKHKIIENKVHSCSYYFATATVNIRSSASKNSTIRGKIIKSQKVCVTKDSGLWKYIRNRGWVYSQFLTKNLKIKKKSKVKKRIKKSVWHCNARSKRASGWVERVGKQNAINGALHQCEIRRQEARPCRIVNCYIVN